MSHRRDLLAFTLCEKGARGGCELSDRICTFSRIPLLLCRAQTVGSKSGSKDQLKDHCSHLSDKMTWPIDTAKSGQPLRSSDKYVRERSQALLPGSSLRNGKDEFVKMGQ